MATFRSRIRARGRTFRKQGPNGKELRRRRRISLGAGFERFEMKQRSPSIVTKPSIQCA